jgi:lantibiotic modifying enzyme
MRTGMIVTARSTWIPLIEGDERDTIEASILEVADDLAGDEWSPSRLHPALAGGNAGQALFYDELVRRWPRPEFSARRNDHWAAAIDGLAQTENIRPNLYSGFTGIGWATILLRSADGPDADGADEDESHEELEEALLAFLEDVPAVADYDLINGPSGWGLYALERWPHPRAVRALERIVDFFESRAERVPQGYRWWTPPSLLPEWQREQAPNGYYNLGLSHGIPGVCVFLSQALERGIRPGVTASLLEGAVDWVLAQRIPGASGLSFPSSVVDGRPPSPSRLAWCYGDLGVAAAVHLIGRSQRNSAWISEALSIAYRAAEVPVSTAGVIDAGLCHGASGVAHLFNRFFQASGDPRFKSAARAWLLRTLEFREEGLGPGGYAAWRTTPTKGWAATPGVLEGSAGIALALLAATGVREPDWDRFIFVSSVPSDALSSAGNPFP